MDSIAGDIANVSTAAPKLLPAHGRIACRKCFTTDALVQEVGLWQVVNDPCAWGASNPTVLVLGFSKGFTQARASLADDFEAIPFKRMRPRLTSALQRIGLLSGSEAVETKFSAAEHTFAFGSLVRCSLSRLDTKTGLRGCSGDIMPKAFVEPINEVVQRCADTYIANLPQSVRVVVMLGTGDPYISGCASLIRSIYGNGFKHINEVSYQTHDAMWVHIAHPSGMNGYFNPWLEGDAANPSGRKLLLAIEALAMLDPPVQRAA